MSKDKIADYDGATAGNNTDIGGISIDEGMLPSTVNNSMRELTRQLGAFSDGTDGIDVLNLHDDDASASIKIQAPATVTTTTTFTLPDGDGTSGYALVTNGSGQLSWASAAGIGNVVEDTTPQLGGALDVNGNSITSASNGDITIDPNGTGDIVLDANVGIGTATPAVASGTGLQIHNAASGAQTRLSLTNNSTGAASSDGMQLVIENGGGALIEQREAQHLGFATSATERMRLTSAGLLGLGVTAPDGKLNVVSTAHNNGSIFDSTGTTQLWLRDTDAASNQKNWGFQVSGGDLNIVRANDDRASGFVTPIYIQQAPANSLVIDTNGSVGIGTVPLAKFHVNSTNSAFYMGYGGNEDIYLQTTNGNVLFTNKGATTERMRLTSAGRLGLGISSPSAGLHVEDDNGAIISRSGYSQYLQLQPANNSVPTILGVGGNGVHIGPTNSTGIRINNSGSVGIGTATPTSASGGKVLAVETTADEHTNLVFNTANTGRNGIIEGRRTGRSGSERFAQINIQNNSDSGEIRFYTASFGNDVSERARLSSAGVLLIGKTADSISNNGISLAGSATGGGNLSVTNDGNSALSLNRKTSEGSCAQFFFNGTVKGSIQVASAGTTFATTSDIRLKQDIEPLEATDKLMAMNPVSYNWKSDPDGPRSMGFIAQEMQEVMPEAVAVGDDEDAMMSMDYGRITPILVSALQDAHKKIEQLESRIAAMETGNE